MVSEPECQPPVAGSQRPPLDGVRVLEIATMLAGPFAGQLLGDYGAEVIKVEHPRLGDPLRGHGPSKEGTGLWWKVLARNKRCVGLYLGTPEGAAVFLKLVQSADVVIDGFRPGTLERWGLGLQRLREANPRIILIRISGFGQTGPYAERAGFGTLAEAMSGFAAMTGEPDGPPTLPPFGLADAIAGITAAFATLVALYQRDMNATIGQEVDLSILEPLVAVLGVQATVFDQLAEIPQRTGNRSTNNAPRNTYRTRDERWVAISTSALSIAERVMTLVGHPEVIGEDWFSTGAGRAAHRDLLDEMVGSWIAERTREEVIDAFTQAQAAVAPVYTVADLLEDPHVQARGTFRRVADPDLGPLLMQDVIARLSETPGRILATGRPLGADTDEILARDAGLSAQDLADLRTSGVIA